MSKIQEAIKLFEDVRGLWIELYGDAHFDLNGGQDFEKALALLESEPDAQDELVKGICKSTNDAARILNSGEDITLDKKPEPTKSTKKFRGWFDSVLKYGPTGREQIKIIIHNVGLQGIEVMLTEARLSAKKGLEACDKIDSQAADLKAKNVEIELYKVIEDNAWDLRCFDEPSGGGDGDYDIKWCVIEHYMDQPKERVIGRGRTPIDAIEQALKGE